MKSFGFKVADSVVIYPGEQYDSAAIIDRLGLPLFVKPNIGGSSFATTKVKAASQLQKAVADAFVEASEVMVESFVSGTEVTCGCFKTEKGFQHLPLTEVVTENEFFDYNAKYKGEVDEITPARIPESTAHDIQQQTERIYNLVNAKGIIRADFIISNGVPVLLEVNTTPGMTETSFIPQQVRDVEGQVGYRFAFFAPDSAQARTLADALQAEGVGASVMTAGGARDWHIYSYWEHILKQKSATPEGCPFTCPYYNAPLPPYAEDMCPRTLDLLSRCVALGLSEWYTESDCAQLAGAVNKVLGAFHTPIEGAAWHDIKV